MNEFWQVFDYLESLPSAPMVNHSKKPGLIAINLNQFAEVALEHRQRIRTWQCCADCSKTVALTIA